MALDRRQPVEWARCERHRVKPLHRLRDVISNARCQVPALSDVNDLPFVVEEIDRREAALFKQKLADVDWFAGLWHWAISHHEVTFRRGQGRTVLPAPFGPLLANPSGTIRRGRTVP
jgi:hypothetical protein